MSLRGKCISCCGRASEKLVTFVAVRLVILAPKTSGYGIAEDSHEMVVADVLAWTDWPTKASRGTNKIVRKSIFN